MRRIAATLSVVTLSLGALVTALPVALGGDAPAKDLPLPPTTPLPKFENPLFDAEVGETCFFLLREPGDVKNKDDWLYFEERVLAKTEKRILVETKKTDETATKDWGIDSPTSGWRDRTETLIPPNHPLPEGYRFLTENEREEILYIGKPGEKPTKAVRTIHRQLEYPEYHEKPNGAKKVRHVWYSHDVAATGVVKRFPASQNATYERLVLSWDKRLSPAECKARAEDYKDDEPGGSKPPPPAMSDSEPGMDGAGMDGAGMEGEPAMGEPGMK